MSPLQPENCMKLIKSATSYRIHLPQQGADLAELCEKKPFRELAPSDFAGSGFIEPVEGEGLVLSFGGGYAFAVRYDEKIVPAAVTTQEAKKRITQLEEEYGRRLGRKERQQIREEVFHDLTLRALTRTQEITSFFLPEHKLLIVPTTSKKLADVVTANLCRVMESVKATTIYVSSVKGSLTTYLKSHLGGDESDDYEKDFPFDFGNQVRLKSEGRSFAFALSEDIEEARQGIEEAVAHGAEVTDIELFDGVTRFRLTQDFKLKGIDNGEPTDAKDFDCHLDLWKHEAAIQSRAAACVINALCELLDFKDLAGEVEKEGEAEEAFA
jgi:recombination associated protein RdgC